MSTNRSDPLGTPDFRTRARMAAAGRASDRMHRYGGQSFEFFNTQQVDPVLAEMWSDEITDTAVTFGNPGTFSAVTFGGTPPAAPVQASSGDTVMCTVSGGGTSGGISVTYTDPDTGDTKSGVLVVPELGMFASIPAGTIVLGHISMMKVAGGGTI